MDERIILEAITGSVAYGLDTPDSDIDLRGIYVAKTDAILGLFPPKETIDKTKPDVTYHEVHKFIRLALKCNPSIVEMLYMTEYTKLTEEGRWLLVAREKFLSRTVYNSYGGYAIAQIKKLNQHGGEYFTAATRHRYSKHARHCFRLLLQGRELLESGTLTVRVTNPAELFAIEEMSPIELNGKFEQEYARFMAVSCVLPEKPDYEAINKLLLTIRAVN